MVANPCESLHIPCVVKQSERVRGAVEPLNGGNDVTPVEWIPGSGSVLLTCEHASQRMPEGYRWPEADGHLLGTHWAYDLGAADLTRELAAALGAPAVLSRFSRLLADPNRPEDSETLFRAQAEGLPVALNTQFEGGVHPEEKERRLVELYRPYHRAVDRLMAESEATVAFSVHSFTPLYEGQRRALEVGILFDTEEKGSLVLVDALQQAGYVAAANEPYSGKLGLMYCVEHHGLRHGKRPIEIEVRQDLAEDAVARARLLKVLAPALQRIASV